MIGINDLDKIKNELREQIIDKYLDNNNINKEDKKETFKFRVYLRKQELTQYLNQYHNTTLFASKEEIQKALNDLTVFNDYLKYKLEDL